MQELVWVGHVHLGRVGDAPGQSLRGSSDLHALEDLSKRIIELLGRSGQPVNRAGLRETLRVNNQRLGDALIALENQRLIRRAKDGWELPVRLSAGDVQMTLM